MDRKFVLDEIKRTAAENGGRALGRQRFEGETGIKPHEWMRFWARFGDAQREAGLEANSLQAAFNKEDVIRRVVDLARELGQFPTHGDLRVKRTQDRTFPSKGVFDSYRKADLLREVGAFCSTNPGNEDVERLCASVITSTGRKPEEDAEARKNTTSDGFVYLMKSGRFYKIGKTNHVGRRERELIIQLPEEAKTVHNIRTDDPDGIEAYWHQRFAAKRKNGEWFDLSREEVAAFKRRKFM